MYAYRLCLGLVVLWPLVCMGCDDGGSGEDVCGAFGVRIVRGGDLYCVYEGQTSMECPRGTSFPHIVDDTLVCSSEQLVAPNVLDLVVADAENSSVTVEVSGGVVRPVDVLWVVDNSGSMCEEQAYLREDIAEFVNPLAAAGLDLQMAVITTDVEDPSQSGRFQNVSNNDPGAQQCNVDVDISHCPTPENGQEYPPTILSSNDPDYVDAAGELDVETFYTHLGCNITTGTTGTGFEMGLEAARLALSPDLTSGANAGFLRDDALLVVIFLTDENDCSDGGALDLVNGNICEWDRDQLISTQEYIDFFSSLKTDPSGNPDPSLIVMGGIVAPSNGVNFNRPDVVEPSCSAFDEWTGNFIGRGFAGYRYSEVIQAFEHVEHNICIQPFNDPLKKLANLIVDKATN